MMINIITLHSEDKAIKIVAPKMMISIIRAGLSTIFRVGGDLGRVGGAWRRPPSAGHSRPEPRSSEGWINWGKSTDRGVWGASPRKIV